MEGNVLLYLLQIVGGVGVPVFIIPIFLVIFIAEYQPVKCFPAYPAAQSPERRPASDTY